MILIVDDEPNNVQVLGSTLSPFGYDIMVASSGNEALEKAAIRTPDLVLLDIRMKGMDGFAVCRKFAETPGLHEIPVIFLSADLEKNTVVKALEAGGVDYVAKPFNKAELLARVRTHLELKNSRDERNLLLSRTETFLESMAHDLKNWIGSASLSLETLRHLEGLPERSLPLIETAGSSVQQALDFVRESLATARESKTDLEIVMVPVSLDLVLAECHAYFSSIASRKEIEIERIGAGLDIVVDSDRIALKRVLDNLLSNAVKFSPPGSTVRVLSRREPPQVEIIDQGPGFSGEDLESAFQAYTRLSARPTAGEPSTGLGLSIVKQLCERLGVEIVIGEADEGGGAAIRLSFGESAFGEAAVA